MKSPLSFPPLWLIAAAVASPWSPIRAESINYDEHIKPIVRQHCLKCHGDDKQKADLNLQNYGAALKGGSGGDTLIAGRSSQSILFQSITDPDEDLRMPPNKPPIPKEQIEMIQQWIDSGLRESSESLSMLKERDTSFKPAAAADGNRPETPAMPDNWPDLERPGTENPLPVLAMDTSAWAPLVAVADQEQVKLINTETGDLLGRLPFPEGVPNVIRFSRDGSVLMVAGGRPVESGKVVLYDVKSGERLTSVGDEVDAVLAADLSPNQKLIALGGSGKVVKVYSTVDGALQYKLEKHTDWITSLAFSPDGKTLASADRAGGLHLWNAESGGIVLSLLEHKQSIRAVDWRPDSKILASVAEDGKAVWWDVSDGFPAYNKSDIHAPKRPKGTYGKIPNGVLAARFSPAGYLATTGRDMTVQIWSPDGKLEKKIPVEGGLPLSTAMAFDQSCVITGTVSGEVLFQRDVIEK
ncbi:MAG: hypothetical protein P1U86_05520 [Verrucomicrobiales bacterium]|nr:hypothetical protein [Verrucomicrobiales bacterium]